MTVTRGILLALLGAAVAAALWAAGAMLLHLDEPVYRLGPVRVAIVLGATAAVLQGARMLARSDGRALPLLALVLAVSVAASLLAIASIGVVLLPPLVFFAILLARESRRQELPTARMVGAAFLVALGLGVIVLAQPYAALVKCEPSGVSISSRPFEAGGSSGSSGSGSGSASIGSAGEASGTLDTGGVRYAYTCRDGKLVRFEKLD